MNLGTVFFISIIKLIQNNCEMILKNYKNWAVVLNRNCLVTGEWLAGRGQAWDRTSINKFGSMTSRWAFCHFLLSHSSRTLTALIFKRTLRFQTLGGWLILHLRYIIDGICSKTVHTSCSVISSGQLPVQLLTFQNQSIQKIRDIKLWWLMTDYQYLVDQGLELADGTKYLANEFKVL